MSNHLDELNEELVKLRSIMLEALELNRKQQGKLLDVVFEKLEMMDKKIKSIEIEQVVS